MSPASAKVPSGDRARNRGDGLELGRPSVKTVPDVSASAPPASSTNTSAPYEASLGVIGVSGPKAPPACRVAT